MRVLIVKLGAIGDIVHALPAAAAIKRNIPDAEISWVVEKRSADILRDSPVIDRLIEIDTRKKHIRNAHGKMPGLSSQASILRRNRYDISLDMQGLLKSGLVSRIAVAKERWGFSRESLREPVSRFMLDRTVKIPPRTHIIRKNLRLAGQALGFDGEIEEIEFPIGTKTEYRVEAEDIVQAAGERFTLLNPAGGWVTKLWPAQNYGKLADRIYEDLGIRSVIVTAPNEAELAEKATAASKSDAIITATPTLKGLYELAKRTEIYIGGDTGPTHIAIAAGSPVVGIFGPTEWWRNGSPFAADICVERLDIDCRVNCHRRHCSKWICMDISVEKVFAAVVKRLENK